MARTTLTLSPEEQLEQELLDTHYPIDLNGPETPEPKAEYSPLQFKTATDLLMWADPNLQTGATVLYPWQLETLDFLSRPEYTKERPLHFQLRAVNGSGKDAFVLAPFAIWHAACLIRSRFIITSSSFKQLNTQTESYIRNLANKINTLMGYKFFIVKRQHIICTATGSEIILFVTDDEGNVEGYHPFPDYPESQMTISANECKTISDKTFTALRRCTGFNRWIEISSPGKKAGHFYNCCCNSVMFPTIYNSEKRYQRLVTAHDCLHISKIEIRRAKEELEEWEYRSIYEGDFTDESEQVVISGEKLEALKAAQVEWNKSVVDLAGGLDLSLGGDETVLATRRGNKITYLDIWRIKDTNVLEVEIDSKLKDRGYVKGSTPIYTDIGGLGKPIFQHLQALGWNVIGVLNNRAAGVKHLYLNGGTEDWFNLKLLIVKKCIILPQDEKFNKQLTSRMYKYTDNSKIKLQDKNDIKESPDRADAVVLAFVNYSAPLSDSIDKYKQEMALRVVNNGTRLTQSDLLETIHSNKFVSAANSLRESRVEYSLSGQESWLELSIRAANSNITKN